MLVWITAYNEPEYLERCVASYLKYTTWPIVILNNWSSIEASRRAVALQSDRVRVYDLNKNIGHAESLALASRCGEETVLLSDQDVEILAPITEEDFPIGVALSGKVIPNFIDPLYDLFTVERFHTSFLLIRPKLLAPVSWLELALPYRSSGIRYDTGAIMYHSTAAKQPISKELEAKYVHYFSDSSRAYVSRYDDEIKDALAVRSSPDDFKKEFERVWDKRCLSFELEAKHGIALT